MSGQQIKVLAGRGRRAQFARRTRSSSTAVARDMGKPLTSEGERVLTLLTDPRLWREGVAASDLAGELNVTVRQLRRDRALLERHGFSTCVEIGDDGVHRVRFARDGVLKHSAGLHSTLDTVVASRDREGAGDSEREG